MRNAPVAGLLIVPITKNALICSCERLETAKTMPEQAYSTRSKISSTLLDFPPPITKTVLCLL
jgi:hypothetical protein